MPFYNLFADRQPDASAGIVLPAMKPLKDDEDALGVLRGNANTVVPYGEGPPVAVSTGRNVDAGRLAAPELDCVSDQVSEQLPQLRAVSHHRRKGVMGYKGPILFNRYLQVVDGLGEDRIGVGGLQFIASHPHAGVRQQVINQVPHADGPIDSEIDELVGIGVELAFVSLGEQLDIARHGA